MLYKGIPVSAGIAIGKAFVIEDDEMPIVKRIIEKEDVKKEIEKFKKAVTDTRVELEKARNEAARHLGKKHTKLFDAYLFIADDPILKEDVVSKIAKDLVNSEYALHEMVQKNVKVFDEIEDEYFRERGKDISDVGKKILRHLTGLQKKTLVDVTQDSIVFANNLTPTDTIAIKGENVKGFATNIGGKTSHTAIMAQAMEIPAVVGMKDITAHVIHNDTVIIDGNEGVVIIKPDAETLEKYHRRLRTYIAVVKELSHYVNVSAVTADGEKIVVAANIEIPEETRSVISHGAQGVGLFRTEYLFMNRKEFPSEDEQLESYKTVVEKVFPNPVIIRTIDLGGDKLLSYFNINVERNPFLGLRAIRFCLKHPEIFKIQLRAILRASAFGNVKMIYPMISGVDELRAANVILNEVKNELRNTSVKFAENMEVGVMMEIPSAALIADVIAKEVDFLSIGTNDLIQYTLAIDRVNEYVTHLYDPLHLSVLRLLKGIIDAGHKAGKWVSMCGEMAGDVSYTEVLLGLGLKHFSVASSSVLRIKKEIIENRLSEAKKTAEELFSGANRDVIVKKIKQKDRD